MMVFVRTAMWSAAALLPLSCNLSPFSQSAAFPNDPARLYPSCNEAFRTDLCIDGDTISE
jgi:hypothetical protein